MSWTVTYYQEDGKKYEGDTRIKKVIIDESVIEITERAFFNCTLLREIEWGDSNCKRIGRGAFYNTGLCEVHLPDSAEVIGR